MSTTRQLLSALAIALSAAFLLAFFIYSFNEHQVITTTEEVALNDNENNDTLKPQPTIGSASKIKSHVNPHRSELLTAFLLGNDTTLLPMISSDIPFISDPRDIDAVVESLFNTSLSDAFRNEYVNLLRRSSYHDLDEKLLAIWKNPHDSPVMRQFALQHLGVSYRDSTINNTTLESLFLGLLSSPTEFEQRESFFALSAKSHPASNACVATISHSISSCRFLDLVVFHAEKNSLSIPDDDLIQLLNHPDEAVAISTISFASKSHPSDAVIRLIEKLTSSESKLVSKSASIACTKLTTQNAHKVVN